MSRIGILFTIPNFITAGSGRAMLNIVRRLDRDDFAPAVCVLRKGGTLDSAVEELGIPFLEAPMLVAPRPLRSLRARILRAATTFRPYGFHIWHSYHYCDDYTEPLVARAAGARAWVYTKKNMSWNRRSWFLRSILASRIASQNTDIMRDFLGGPFLRGKATLLPPGVETERFRPGLSRQRDLRAELGFPPEAIVAGCVGHLLPVKGHPTLLEAIEEVPELHLVIAGDSLDRDYAARLHGMVARAGLEARVRFLGNVADIPSLWAELEIGVVTTWDRWRMEGCPIALLEAMSCGVACVATDIPGCHDVIESETNGLLVAPRDPVSLSRALTRLVKDAALRQRLGEAGRARIVARYTIERETAAYVRLYREALGQKVRDGMIGSDGR